MTFSTDGILLAISAVSWLVLAIWLLSVTISIRRLNSYKKAVAKAGEDGDFVSAVENSLRELPLLRDNISEVRAEHAKLARALSSAVQRVGLVRFDAFDDVGGRLSFALALLNDHGDGVVISAISGRQEGRTYAKFIKGGESDYNLSIEEREAIAEALAVDKARDAI